MISHHSKVQGDVKFRCKAFIENPKTAPLPEGGDILVNLVRAKRRKEIRKLLYIFSLSHSLTLCSLLARPHRFLLRVVRVLREDLPVRLRDLRGEPKEGKV